MKRGEGYLWERGACRRESVRGGEKGGGGGEGEFATCFNLGKKKCLSFFFSSPFSFFFFLAQAPGGERGAGFSARLFSPGRQKGLLGNRRWGGEGGGGGGGRGEGGC